MSTDYRRSPEFRAAAREGQLRSDRAQKAREDVLRIIAALREAGHAHLLGPRMIHDAALIRALEAMRAGGAADFALRRALARRPRTVCVYLRRNRDLLAELSAQP